MGGAEIVEHVRAEWKIAKFTHTTVVKRFLVVIELAFVQRSEWRV